MSLRRFASFLTSENWYWRLHRHLTPGLRNAQYTYFAKLEQALQPGSRWLEVGCGRQIVPPWMRDHRAIEKRMLERAGEVVGIDPDAEALAENTLPMVKHHGPADRIPEPNGSFDLISANMVAEHLEHPERVLTELSRLLKPGGRVIMHTPNVLYPVTLAAAAVPFTLRQRLTAWLEQRAAETIYPTWYRFNRCRHIRQLANENGLEVVEIERLADSPETIGLGPLVGIEMSVIAVTRSRFMNALASNLIITLTKPAVASSLPINTLETAHAADQQPMPKEVAA